MYVPILYTLYQTLCSMSFRKPRRPRSRRRRQRSPSGSPSDHGSRSISPTPGSQLVPSSMVLTERRPRNYRSQGPDISGPRPILSIPGRDFVQQFSTSRGRQHQPRQHQVSRIHSPDLDMDAADDSHMPTSDFDFTTDVFYAEQEDTAEQQREKLQRKKERLWKRWAENVIPSLLRPHLQLLRQSKSLRSIPRSLTYQCSCNSNSQTLEVVCVFFDRKYMMVISGPSVDVFFRAPKHSNQIMSVFSSRSPIVVSGTFPMCSACSHTGS